MRTTLADVRKGNEVAVIRDLRRVHTAESPEGAKATWDRFREQGKRSPEAVARWEEYRNTVLYLLRYPPAIRPYLRSANLLDGSLVGGRRCETTGFPTWRRWRSWYIWSLSARRRNGPRVYGFWGNARGAEEDVPGQVSSATASDTNFVTLPYKLLGPIFVSNMLHYGNQNYAASGKRTFVIAVVFMDNFDRQPGGPTLGFRAVFWCWDECPLSEVLT